MKKNNKNGGLIATIVIMSGVIVILLITILVVKTPTIFNFVNFDFFKKQEAIVEPTKENIEETKNYIEIVEAPRLDVTINTYEGYKGSVSIEYPEITGMADVEMQKKVNDKLRTNALSIVPLYPISTALQNLDICCQVNYLDEKYITVLYTGEVIGKNVNKSSGGGSTTKATNNSDLYLNGAYDPYANGSINQSAVNNIVSNAANISLFGDLPLPKVNTETYDSSANTKNKSGQSNQLNGKKTDVSDSTADKGPTVYENPGPGKRDRSVGPNTDDLDMITGPGVNKNITTNNLPISSFAGTNTSASTIDQKIFYCNTIDLKTGLDVSLPDLVSDLSALAKYARSSKAELVNVDASKVGEVRAYIRKTIPDTLTEHMKNESDFRNTDLKIWPKHFSFLGSDGYVYFTIKLSSKLGNYAIIKYKK